MEFGGRDPERDKTVINNKTIEEIISKNNYFRVLTVDEGEKNVANQQNRRT